MTNQALDFLLQLAADAANINQEKIASRKDSIPAKDKPKEKSKGKSKETFDAAKAFDKGYKKRIAKGEPEKKEEKPETPTPEVSKPSEPTEPTPANLGRRAAYEHVSELEPLDTSIYPDHPLDLPPGGNKPPAPPAGPALPQAMPQLPQLPPVPAIHKPVTPPPLMAPGAQALTSQTPIPPPLPAKQLTPPALPMGPITTPPLPSMTAPPGGKSKLSDPEWLTRILNAIKGKKEETVEPTLVSNDIKNVSDDYWKRGIKGEGRLSDPEFNAAAKALQAMTSARILGK